MDNPNPRLDSHKDASGPSLEDTLWEMDDVILSEPVLLPGTSEPGSPEQSSSQNFMATAPHRSPVNTSTPPRSTVGVKHEPYTTGFRFPSVPPQASVAQSSGNRLGVHWAEPQGSAWGTPSPARGAQRWGTASAQVNSNGHCLPPPLRSPPSETSFMKLYPGDATISYLNNNGEAQSITGVSVWAIEQSCPLLAAAFEPRSSGPQLHLEILTKTTAMPFLRFLYTGTYAINGESGDVYEDVPTSLLLHCQLYHLGDLYDLRPLMQQANVNIIRQCEFGCSSPNQPIHLSAAIKYAYEHLSGHAGVLDTIVSYCVSCFLRHRLAEDDDFKSIAFELKPFHQALCRESMNRKFENESTYGLSSRYSLAL